MQLEDMSTAELIALVKRQEQELAAQPVQQPAPVASTEAAAKAIYVHLPAQQGKSPADYPWQDGGNSHMQTLARDMARAALLAAPVAMPEGWEIHRIGDTIRVNHEAVGRVFLPRTCKDPSDVVLYHLAESLLAAPVAAPVAGQEPYGWQQHIDGVRTQNFARDEQELEQIKMVFRLMKTPGTATYLPLYTAAPVPAASMQTDSAEYQRGFAAGRLDAHRLHKSVTFKAMAQRDEVMSGAPPNSVQPNDDWTMDDVDLAGKIMLLLGRAASCSREPGADSLRDRIALMLNKHSAANVAQVGELSHDSIQQIFLASGFTIKEGQSDLKDYVYKAAYAILAAAKKGPTT